MAMPERYVFVRLNQRPRATPRAPAWTGGGRRVQRPARGAAPALLTNVKVVAAGCMEGCLAGPGLLLTPTTAKPAECRTCGESAKPRTSMHSLRSRVPPPSAQPVAWPRADRPSSRACSTLRQRSST